MLHNIDKQQTSGRLLSIFLLLAVLACSGPKATLPSQTEDAERSGIPYKRLLAAAEESVAAGDFNQGAEYYLAAYQQKPRRKEVLHRAAELFTRARNYRAAADAYQYLDPDEDRWPLLGLRYGRALKQDGRYDQARRELATFLETYNGADRPIVSEIVRNELAGISLVSQTNEEDAMVDIYRPGRGINTRADEFGPVAVAGDQLFFTSTAGGQSRLYQSRLQAREWTKATVPPGFPVIAEGAFGTGSLSPDGRVFFFTICSGVPGEDATNRCEIFRGERNTAGSWSQPVRLGAAVNAPGTNNAFPYVTLGADGRYQLYFASDRPGGRGGMDLYLSVETEPRNPDGFSAPANLGPTINTVSDEISPVWIPASGRLYFASDGHPGFGGLDIFLSTGGFGAYQRPENMGRPVNSAADDYGLSLTDGSGVGYLTSNRTFTGGKEATTETDIFVLNFRAGRAKLKATVYDNTTGAELAGAEVSLFEEDAAGGQREIARRTFPTGVYTFDLRPGGKYRVMISRAGYQPKTYRVETNGVGSSLYGQPVFLLRNSVPDGGQGARPRVLGEGVKQGESALPDPAPDGRPTAGNAPNGPSTAPASAPNQGLTYRIQISAQRKFNPSDSRYDGIRALGNLVAEPIPDRRLQRILLGNFPDPESAKRTLERVRANGFSSAFLVEYEDGKRKGQVRQ